MEQDRVQAELAAKREPGAVLRRLRGLKQLASLVTGGGVPRPIRVIMEEAFSRDTPNLYLITQHRSKVGEQLKDLSAADWQRLIETLVPQVAPAAIAAREALVRRPYQEGLGRRPFRCPRSATTLADVQGRWLLSTTVLLGEYDADIRWIAERAAHLAGWSGGSDLGWLLAGALDRGDATADAVREILEASARGEHETGLMGRHVTQAFMSAGSPRGWEFVEKLLLAAQRQEGLRQAILESVDESHPQAFQRMLRLILDQDLARFSSVVRAADTWFGFGWDGSSGIRIERVLERVLHFLEDDAARAAALDESEAETVYLALWSIAFEDVDRAIAPASVLLGSASAEVRFVATHFLVQTLWNGALPPLLETLADPDLRVAARALDLFATGVTSLVDGERLFAELERLMARLPKRARTLDPLVWPWWQRKLERPQVAAAMAANAGAVAGERLLPYVPDLEPSARAAFLRRAAGLAPRWGSPVEVKPRKLSAGERTVALDLLGDASPDVRSAAFQAMGRLPLLPDEVDRLIDLLGRKPGDLRSGTLARLRGLSDPDLLATADRLLADGSELRRLAGLELLRDAGEQRRAEAEVRARMERYAAERPSLGDQEQAHVTGVLARRSETATLDDALGLIAPAALPTWPEPRAGRLTVETDGARRSLEALAELVLSHQQTEVTTTAGEVKLLVESAHWGFGPRKREDLEEGGVAPPLAAVWRSWLGRRPDRLRDPDGLELLRALMAEEDQAPWKSRPAQQVRGLGQYSAGARFLRGLCEWCIAWEPPAGGVDFLLDGLEDAIAALSAADYREMETQRAANAPVVYVFGDQRLAFREKLNRAEEWLQRFRWWRSLFPGSVQPAHDTRVYRLLRAFERKSNGFRALRVILEDFLAAYHAGSAAETEFLALLAGPGSHQPHGSMLRAVSSRKPPRGLTEHPELLALVERCRRRVVEVETRRGDRETAASGLAMELRWTGGLETLTLAVPALGKTHFARTFGWSASGASRQDTLSHLVLRSLPREEDTPEAFARWAREARVKESRLVELAVYAPQWAAHVNQVLGWPGLEGAVWWIQAHTKDDRSWQLQELKELWAASVSERTPLAAADLTEGAVDVAWFAAVYGTLGEARWKALDAAAKYAASSGGHTRAQLFARAMAGLVSREELVARIESSRHQDSVRALGLLPLAQGEQGQRDLLERYRRLEEFRRGARKFGSQRQQSESRAVAIGLANLARTAGYRDPQRLQWAMEQRTVADLADGPVVLTRADVTLSLSVTADGVPALALARQGKPLKTLPAALKKDAEVEELRARYQDLKRQRSRVRDALETAMCRQDRFSAAELAALLRHPVLAVALSRLVFAGDGLMGYPAEGGRALRDHAGRLQALGQGEEVHVAHPGDLLARGDWSAWQRECYRAERVQPFKQVFRELYPLTAAERGAERSRRYAGHQVNPRQALALLGGRGWVARPEEGVSRTFHEAGLTARLGFQEAFYTPADIEGLTLEEVVFTRKGEWKELRLDQVPALLFSETMRDLDLVVSVAHRGGVDPEASASTVEMRAALVQETCQLLNLDNVTLEKHHALIAGGLGRYSVHLGSAGVMLLPGTALPIVAVHSQHRGRLFLPFADADPRTAEVLSKVLMLARDKEIRDPNILEWIRAGQGGAG